MNKIISNLPFEIYELHLFYLVAKHKNFTRAAEKAHLTQSAITRQIQGMESRLGTALFTRNTRNVQLTAAGEVLFERSTLLLRHVEETIQDVEKVKLGRAQVIRLGVCRSIGLSYLPGFITVFRREYPGVQFRIQTHSSTGIVASMVEGGLDVGVIHSLPSLPRQIEIARRIADDFTFILPARGDSKKESITEVVKSLPLLMPEQNSHGRELIEGWLRRQNVEAVPAMELDNVDLVVNLVGLGLGCSLVPHRALPLYLQRGLIERWPLKPPLSRTLMVIIPKARAESSLARTFIEKILFS